MLRSIWRTGSLISRRGLSRPFSPLKYTISRKRCTHEFSTIGEGVRARTEPKLRRITNVSKETARNVLQDDSVKNEDSAKDKESVNEQGNTEIKLREYQEECIQSVLQAIADGRRQVGVSLATGSGKTVIFTELIDRIVPPAPQATQTLILAHRRELIEQAAKHCRRRYPDKTIEIEMGALHASGTADITVASIQSLKNGDRLNKFDPDDYKLILVDEAHHIVASSYLTVLKHFGLVSSDGDEATPSLVGVSATFSRFDGLALGKVIKHIVYHKDYVDMIGDRWLSDVIFTTVKSNAKLSQVAIGSSGDFLSSSLSAAVNTDEINLVTVRSWLAKAHARKSTIVFCVDLAHVTSLTNTFRSLGIDARFVTGDTPSSLRSARLDEFKQGAFPVLLNCGVFIEGTDIPNIDCVLLARPTKSRNLLVQMIGRGMRLHPGKANCHIIDMVGSLESGIVTAPTLFGLDPDEILDAADAKSLKARKDEPPPLPKTTSQTSPSPTTTTVTFKDYSTLSSLLDDTAPEQHIRRLSTNAWVAVDSARYILQDGSAGSYLSVSRSTSNDAPWTLGLVQANPVFKALSKGSPYMRPRTLASTPTLEAAVRAGDTYAGAHFRTALTTLLRLGSWRSRPASAAQLALLNKFRSEEEQLEEGELSKGRAVDMITKLKFGARGKVARNQGARRREEGAREKGERAKRRARMETVRVGPVGDVDLDEF